MNSSDTKLFSFDLPRLLSGCFVFGDGIEKWAWNEGRLNSCGLYRFESSWAFGNSDGDEIEAFRLSISSNCKTALSKKKELRLRNQKIIRSYPVDQFLFFSVQRMNLKAHYQLIILIYY